MFVPGNTPIGSASTRQKRGFFARWREALQVEWKAFTSSPAGKRFQDRYQRKRGADRPAWKKIVSPVIGITMVTLGLVLLPAPGPGIPVVLLGLALVAEHFLWAAKFLDRCEGPLRALLSACVDWWKRASAINRWAAGIFVVLLLAALGATLFAVLMG